MWGHVNVIGRGAGQAVLQLNVKYGIDWEELRDLPKQAYFELHIDETYSNFRNKSHIQVKACVRYVTGDEQMFTFESVKEKIKFVIAGGRL